MLRQNYQTVVTNCSYLCQSQNYTARRTSMHQQNFTSAFNLTGLTVLTVVPCFYRRKQHIQNTVAHQPHVG